MKYIILIAIGMVATSLLLAQGPVISNPRVPTNYPSYDPNTSAPPIGLSTAYALAQRAIGNGTNTFYCVSASCIGINNAGAAGWRFTYANTNGQRGRVEVSFDGQASVTASQGEVYIQR